MLRKFLFSVICIIALSCVNGAMAATRASDYVSENTYNNLYPYMNNTMRTNLNPGVTPSQSNAQINVLARTKNTNSSNTRNVVSRSATTSNTTTARRATTTSAAPRAATTGTSVSARAATNATPTRNVSQRRATSGTTTARAATSNRNNTARVATSIAQQSASPTRRAVTRSATNSTRMQSGTSRSSRADGNVSTARQTSTDAVYTTSDEAVSSARCMADYVDCMNDYCERADTEYNRCYCSSQLAQIDSMYQPAIDSLIKEILTIRNESYWTAEEMDEYWMETVGQYTGGNSWANLEDALDIDWAGTESRVRGQQAFAMGHQYCVQHLRGCSYMQTNMRDAYRSEIARDCAAYETSLQKLKNAAESIVEAYK